MTLTRRKILLPTEKGTTWPAWISRAFRRTWSRLSMTRERRPVGRPIFARVYGPFQQSDGPWLIVQGRANGSQPVHRHMSFQVLPFERNEKPERLLAIAIVGLRPCQKHACIGTLRRPVPQIRHSRRASEPCFQKIEANL